MTQLWLKWPSAWLDFDSTQTLDFLRLTQLDSTHLSRSRVKFDSWLMSRAQPCLRSTGDLRGIVTHSKVWFWFLIPPKVTADAEPTLLRHHRNPLVISRQMIYLLFSDGQNQGWPQGQGQVKHPHAMNYVREVKPNISRDSGVQCHHNGALLDSLSQLDRKLLAKNSDGRKGPLWCYLSRHKK